MVVLGPRVKIIGLAAWFVSCLYLTASPLSAAEHGPPDDHGQRYILGPSGVQCVPAAPFLSEMDKTMEQAPRTVPKLHVDNWRLW
jgi:hypothetical protein